MTRFDAPTFLITRPEASSQQFVDALHAAAGPFSYVISPAFSYEGVSGNVPVFSNAIFTSQTGVLFAPIGEGRTAWCVGDATAAVARAAGYDAISAGGDVKQLLDMILARRPDDSLLHIRGEITAGNITQTLLDAGLRCNEIIVYRKVRKLPSPDVARAYTASAGFIIPAFSAETVSILADWPIDFSTSHAIAISPTVAEACEPLNCAQITVCARPTQREMVGAAARLIA